MMRPYTFDVVTGRGVIDGMTKEETFEYQYNLDTLTFILSNYLRQTSNFKFMIGLFMINAAVDLIRHFYANPSFSIVPKTLTYSASKMSFLILVILLMICGYGTFLVVLFSIYTDTFITWR